MSRAGDVVENPVTGERAVVRLGTEESGGELLVAEGFVKPGGAVAGEHVHPNIHEWFTVVSGRVGFLFLGAGGLTALTLWRERVLMSAQQTAADNRFAAIANRRPAQVGVYRVEDQPSSRVPAE